MLGASSAYLRAGGTGGHLATAYAMASSSMSRTRRTTRVSASSSAIARVVSGDGDGDGLRGVDSAEGDPLPADQDDAGGASAALHSDGFGGGSRWRSGRACAAQPGGLLPGQWVGPGAQQLAGSEVVVHQRGGLDADADLAAAEDLGGEQAAGAEQDQPTAGDQALVFYGLAVGDRWQRQVPGGDGAGSVSS